jgi:AcrR family transcriptional regulator
LRERQRESTASEILSAAERVFIERGIFETHMADIAASAGVAVGTLYNHYKDRDALLTALIAQRKSELLERIDAALADSRDRPFREQLREMLHIIFTHFDEHFQFFSVFTQGECGPPLMAQGSLAIQREIYKRYAELIERGHKQGALRPKIAKLAPAMLMGISRSMLMRRFFVPEETSALEHLGTVIDFFFEGASQPEAGKPSKPSKSGAAKKPKASRKP